MVAMTVRDEHIVQRTQIDAHLFCITDKHIAGSCVKQDTMPFRLQQDRQAMFRLQLAVLRAVIL